MTIRTLYLPALIVAGMLLACTVVVLALSERAEATFPGKNSRIAYASYDAPFPKGDSEIYTIRADGSGKRQLTNNDADEIDPAYSPSGKRIAYAGQDGPKGDLEIYTMGASGGDKVQVTHNDVDDEWPTYSPSGKRIAYTPIEGTDALFSVRASGGDKRLVARAARVSSYSPDGERIAYECYGSSPRIDTDICTIGVRGGHKVRVTHNDTDDFNPDYSPDGRRIVYQGFEGRVHLEQDVDASANIYTIKVGGGGNVNLTKSPKNASLWNGWPSYSPDGRRREDRLHGSRRRDLHHRRPRGREVPSHQRRCVPPEALLG